MNLLQISIAKTSFTHYLQIPARLEKLMNADLTLQWYTSLLLKSDVLTNIVMQDTLLLFA